MAAPTYFSSAILWRLCLRLGTWQFRCMGQVPFITFATLLPAVSFMTDESRHCIKIFCGALFISVVFISPSCHFVCLRTKKKIFLFIVSHFLSEKAYHSSAHLRLSRIKVRLIISAF